jgi:predicted  nucleic acid-binding Zn-ribbon protein
VDYEYYYNSARSRYYEACSEMNACEGRGIDLRNRRQQVMSRINQINIDIGKAEETLETLDQTLKESEGLDQSILAVTDKLGKASTDFIAMVTLSGVSNRSMSDASAASDLAARRGLDGVLGDIKAKRAAQVAKVTDLKTRLRQAEAELQDIEAGIRAADSDQQYWRQRKACASYDIEYYRRKMNDAA